MRVAILGAGFCGLAVAWNLAQFKIYDITLFDPNGIGQGASGVAAGLLHGYVGAHAKRNWRATEGLKATTQLLKIAENYVKKPVAHTPGILRPALNSSQLENFSFCAHQFPDTKWMDVAQCQQAVGGMLPFPGLFIESGMVIDCPLYLKGLWFACEASGVKFEQIAIKSLKDVCHFDRVVVALGAATISLPELANVAIKPVKGQVLEMEWPDQVKEIPFPVNSQAYLLMNLGKKTCIAGATYERGYNHIGPDRETAINEIFPKLHAFYPGFDASSIIDCRTGIRAATYGHHPLLVKYSANCWVLTGMGSKGLMYHALFAEEIAKQMQLYN